MRAITALVLGLALCLAPSVARAQSFQSVGELLENAQGVSILQAALSAAGLDELAADSELVATVFAPTDAAFEAALASLNMTAEEVLGDQMLLTEILSYHIVPGEALELADLEEGRVLQTLLEGPTGQLQFFRTANAQALPRLLTTSLQRVPILQSFTAGQASVYIINRVMLPGDDVFANAEAPAPAPAMA